MRKCADVLLESFLVPRMIAGRDHIDTGIEQRLDRGSGQPRTVGAVLAVGDDEIEVEESSDALLDAIVALDDLFQAGKLPEKAYQERRADLKARLVQVMDNEKR